MTKVAIFRIPIANLSSLRGGGSVLTPFAGVRLFHFILTKGTLP
jgi:hypothetical protein